MELTAIFPSPQPQKPFVLRPRHEQILTALYDFEYLNAQHVQRLFYGPNTKNYPAEAMRALVTNGYCYAAPFHKPQAGKAEHQFHLNNKGNAFLRSLGKTPKKRLRKSELAFAYQHWDHLIALNHVLISLRLFAKDHPAVEERLFLHDYDFKRLRHRVTLPDGTVKQVWPDGLIDFRFYHRGQAYQHAVLVECDRGSEDKPTDWFEKLDKLIALIDGPLREVYGIEMVHVAVTTPNERRRETLRLWTHSHLTKRHPRVEASQFFFTSVDPITLSPGAFVLSPVWHFVGENETVGLLEVPSA